MKKLVLFALVAMVAVFQFCSSSKKAAIATVSAVTYTKNVQPLIQANCSPCHFPQGRGKALNTYDAAKGNINDILTAIHKNPGEKGFMPMRHPKLADSTIAVFEKWKENGMAE